MKKRKYVANNSSVKNRISRQIFTKITSSSIANYLNSQHITENDGTRKYRILPTSEWKKYIEKSKKKQQDAGIIDGIHITNKFNIDFTEDTYRFDTKKDPISAFHIFVKCVEDGLYPPSEVLSFISNKFNTYLNGNKSLDAVFSTSQKAKKEYKINKRNLNIGIEIDTLKHYFGIKPDDAINAVLRRIQETDNPLGDDSITSIYNKKTKKLIESSTMNFHDQFHDITDDDDDDQKDFLENILAKYPEDVIDDLKNNYPLIKKLLSTPIEKLKPATPSDHS